MPLIPFDKIEQNSQPQLRRASDLVASTTSEGSSSSAIPASAIVTTPRTQSIEPPVMDRQFFLLNGIHLGMGLLDIGMTQRCVASHQCKEGNPLMPSSMAGQLGVTVGLFAYSAGGSYYLKKHRARAWWIPPISGMATHAVGVASGLAH
ncbi:MAG: hypothetical protein WBX09_03040 [Terracidiphilus sp.]